MAQDKDTASFEGLGQPLDKYRARNVMYDVTGLQATAGGYRLAATNHQLRATTLNGEADRLDQKAKYLAELFLKPLEGATEEQIAYLEALEEEHDTLVAIGRLSEEQIVGLEQCAELGGFITEIASHEG